MPRVNLGMGEREKLYLEELRERTEAGTMNQTEFAVYIGVRPQAAAKMLASAGIRDVRIEAVNGFLTDHYDPKERVRRLSDSVYSSMSVASIGVAAHEAGVG